MEGLTAVDIDHQPAVPCPDPSVSVVLCTWNGSRFVENLLSTITAQDRMPDEMIAFDDASTDGTAGLLRTFAATAPFPVHIEINEHRLGSTRNFEAALRRSRGRIIALADQDDEWYPQKLARLTALMDEDPILTLVFSDAALIDEEGRPASAQTLWEARHVARYLRRHEVIAGPVFARRALSTGCTMAVRRRALDAALPFPASLDDPGAPMRHDRWLALIAATVGTAVAVPEPLLSFRLHDGQQTGVLGRRALIGRLGKAVRAATAGDDDRNGERAHEHDLRAAQVLDAARRADAVGDFEEADALRRVVAHHRFRATGPRECDVGVRDIAREVWIGGYDRSFFGLASAVADATRVVRRPRS